jgi:hypothetical protein
MLDTDADLLSLALLIRKPTYDHGCECWCVESTDLITLIHSLFHSGTVARSLVRVLVLTRCRVRRRDGDVGAEVLTRRVLPINSIIRAHRLDHADSQLYLTVA